MNLEKLKEECNSYLNKQIDFPNLYKTYYNLTRSEIEELTKTLMKNRNLINNGLDFNYLLDHVFYEPETPKYVYEIQNLITKIDDGKILSDQFLNDSLNNVVNLTDYVNSSFSINQLKKLINYIPNEFSTSSIGKGEFAFVILLNGATKPKNGGDLFYNGYDIEIKGLSSKLANQSSHNTGIGSISKIKSILNITDLDFELPPISPLQLNEFYIKNFGVNKTIDVLKTFFKTTMPKLNEDEFEWYNELNVNNNFNIELWKSKQPIFEYDYYKKIDKFDILTFINPENLNVLSFKEEITIDKLQYFNIQYSYRFNANRIQTSYWKLK